MTTNQPRTNAILPFSALNDTDFTGLEGLFVDSDAATGRVKLVTSATASPFGVILKGAKAPEKNSIALCAGLAGTVRLKLGADVVFGDNLKLRADAKVEPATGGGGEVLVGVALEAGVAGELIEAALCTPLYLP